jgi:succinyl-CoA synthetase alpha subunit
MGYAGVITSGASCTAQAKGGTMKAEGIHVCDYLGELEELCAEVFSSAHL